MCSLFSRFVPFKKVMQKGEGGAVISGFVLTGNYLFSNCLLFHQCVCFPSWSDNTTSLVTLCQRPLKSIFRLLIFISAASLCQDRQLRAKLSTSDLVFVFFAGTYPLQPPPPPLRPPAFLTLTEAGFWPHWHFFVFFGPCWPVPLENVMWFLHHLEPILPIFWLLTRITLPSFSVEDERTHTHPTHPHIELFHSQCVCILNPVSGKLSLSHLNWLFAWYSLVHSRRRMIGSVFSFFFYILVEIRAGNGIGTESRLLCLGAVRVGCLFFSCAILVWRFRHWSDIFLLLSFSVLSFPFHLIETNHGKGRSLFDIWISLFASFSSSSVSPSS